MSALAPRLEAFFTERLGRQLQASPHTVAAYRDTFRLLLRFASSRSGKEPCQLDFVDIDGEVVGAFLEHLEHERHNGVVHPQRPAGRDSLLLPLRRLLRAPSRRPDRPGARHPRETDPTDGRVVPHTGRGRSTRCTVRTGAPGTGVVTMRYWSRPVRRGLRVGELRGLQNRAVELGTGAHVRVHGKGRKDRCTPLTAHTVAVLGVWMRERQENPTTRCSRRSPVAPSATTLSRTSWPGTPPRPASCPTMSAKRVTPHVLRHRAPWRCWPPGSDTSVIAAAGSDTSTSRPPRSTSTAICRSRSGRWPGPRRQEPRPVATAPRTSCWPSSEACRLCRVARLGHLRRSGRTKAPLLSSRHNRRVQIMCITPSGPPCWPDRGRGEGPCVDRRASPDTDL